MIENIDEKTYDNNTYFSFESSSNIDIYSVTLKRKKFHESQFHLEYNKSNKSISFPTAFTVYVLASP